MQIRAFPPWRLKASPFKLALSKGFISLAKLPGAGSIRGRPW
jgi:hypothetical protein